MPQIPGLSAVEAQHRVRLLPPGRRQSAPVSHLGLGGEDKGAVRAQLLPEQAQQHRAGNPALQSAAPPQSLAKGAARNREKAHVSRLQPGAGLVFGARADVNV